MTQAEADAHFAAWMRSNLSRAAAHFDLTTVGEPVFGWRLRSISARAEGFEGPRWLRVVSQEPEWAHGDHWTGTKEANAITGIAKPQVLGVHEWVDGRCQRAEVMTVVPVPPCSPTDTLRSQLDLGTEWWSALTQSLDIIAHTPTERVYCDQAKVSDRIQERFGPDAATTVTEWETVHGDLHWSNLTCPQLAILDWELWGRGPAGTDAATLLCYSLLVPDIANKVQKTFVNQLGSPTGRIAQLYVIARLLRRVDGGDFPDLAAALRVHARRLLD